jgi:hypothetical protein
LQGVEGFEGFAEAAEDFFVFVFFWENCQGGGGQPIRGDLSF